MSVPAKQARELFLAAVKMRPEGWPAYLAEACGGDEELRRRVSKLLQAHQEAGSFLAPDAPPPDATVDDPICERPGTVIGPYRLMEQIGEGGMGLVFVAEQQQPVRRKVALKLIKPGMDTRQVVARFEAERQALALMDHPNIAKVLDGGETASGLPYFVMELVKGVPITEYCDHNQVPVRERLELFVHVCQAVQHAHQKGIIHRDVKPSNVLVMSQDGTPVVKVIDFGIAKAVGQQLTDKTIYTQFAQLVGTPLYMSPEQAGRSGVDVDTRTDIYALGVLLYELLTGVTPFDRERLRQVDYDEIRRIIREEEPPRPSTRISTLGQAASTVSSQRKSDVKQLSRLCRGELDWIVMKALEKDRNRRYETATSFARDVERYLHDEPVQACPPSLAYRLRKFARRNRAALTTLVLVAAALLTTVVVLVISNISISREEKEKSAALEELKEKARLLAHQNQEVERKNQEIEQARQALEKKARQMALTSKYKSEFLANMSHELRTPLNSLLILSDQLCKNSDGNLTPRQTEIARTIHSSGNDLLMLINDILDLSRIESGTVIVDAGELRLDDLQRYVERTFRHVAESKNLDFQVHFDPRLPRSMYTDSRRLQRIIKNLLSNAFTLTHHGHVILTVQPVQSGWSAENKSLSRAGEVLAFVVSDTGIGISSDKQQIIFKASQQADGSTGLSLAISRVLSRLLGGEIRLASMPGGGSTFTLFLPVTYSQPRSTRTSSSGGEAAVVPGSR